jgi:hypothetical protein
MRIIGANTFDRQARRGWFAETLVVFGILAFAYVAITLQPPNAEPILDFQPSQTIR